MTFKDELRQIFPKFEDKVIDRLDLVFGDMDNFLMAKINDISNALWRCASNKVPIVVKKINIIRELLYIGVDDIYDTYGEYTNTEGLVKLVKFIQSHNEANAVEMLDRIIRDLAEKVKEQAEYDTWNKINDLSAKHGY